MWMVPAAAHPSPDGARPDVSYACAVTCPCVVLHWRYGSLCVSRSPNQMAPALSLVFEDKHPQGARAGRVLSVICMPVWTRDTTGLRAETMSNSNFKAAVRAYMAEHGVNYTTAKRAVKAGGHRSASRPDVTVVDGVLRTPAGRIGAFPFAAITVAYGPDRAEVFDAATAHFTDTDTYRFHAEVPAPAGADAAFRYRFAVAGRPHAEFAQWVRSMSRMDALDEVAIPDLDKAEDPAQVAALLMELALTGSALVVSLNVPTLAAAHQVFLRAFVDGGHMPAKDAAQYLTIGQFVTLDDALLADNAARATAFEQEQEKRAQVASRALLNAKEDVAGTRRRLAKVNPAFGDVVDGLVRPFARMRPGTGTPKVTGSYVGGYPFVPAGSPEDKVWPVDDDGAPMAFLCQINFAEVADALKGTLKGTLDGFPAEGMLQWFIGGPEHAYGQTYNSPTTGFDGLHVRWYTAADLTAPALHSPDAPIPCDATIEGPLNEVGPTKVTFRAATGLPGHVEVTDGHTPDARTVADMVSTIETAWEGAEAADDTKALDMFERLFDGDIDQIWDGSDLGDPNGFGAGDRVGGYPSLVQADPRAAHPDRAQTLLIQLDSDSGFFTTWGDGGSGQLFGDPAALANGDTSSLWWSWSCH